MCQTNESGKKLCNEFTLQSRPSSLSNDSNELYFCQRIEYIQYRDISINGLESVLYDSDRYSRKYWKVFEIVEQYGWEL